MGLQVAAEVVDEFPDGVFFVPLAPLTDPALVPSAIAEAVGVREEGGQPLRERLQAVLATKLLLLVLDNVEHLIAAAPVVGALLGACPGLKVLATSRIPLRLRGEQEVAVPPLGLPRRKPPPPPEQLSQYEAVRLFIARAQAVKADLTISNETAPAIAEICWRLDGLPLAIELAAARIRMLSPQAMLSRLEQRLPLLTGGARDLPARQQTLRNTIAWSYDLLSSEEQALFRRVAVFAGGASFEAVEAVANPDGQLDVFGGLERLVEHNLLRQEEGLEGEPRFSMLETIREFGLDQLQASGEVEEIRQGHATFFLRMAETADPELMGREQALWLNRLETEHDNFRVALGWALDHASETALRLAGNLWYFWLIHGHLAEGRGRLERALARSAGIPAAVRAKALEGAGELARQQGALQEAVSRCEAALALYRELGNQRGMGIVLSDLSLVARHSGDVDRAVAMVEEAEAIFRSQGDAWGLACVLINRGALAHQHEDYDRAEALYEEALRLARQIGDLASTAIALANLGQLALARRNEQRAATLYEEGVRLAWELGDQHSLAVSLEGFAALAMRGGSWERSARLLGTAEALRERAGAAIDAIDLPLRETTLEVVRRQLGDTRFDSVRESGRTLSLEEAVAEGLALADELANSLDA
jgi:predicted ATPase